MRSQGTTGDPHARVQAKPAETRRSSASARISAIWRLPDILREFGVDVGEALALAGIRPDVFDDRENLITYPQMGRLLSACERLSGCDHVAFLVCRRACIGDFGVAAQIALCSDTVGDALSRFSSSYNLHSTASIISLITAGDYTRVAFAVVEARMTDTRHFQLGSVTTLFNILRELCGGGFLPTVVTFASHAPADLRPFQRYFRAPVRFDSGESAVVFERRWLDRSLPPVDPARRQAIEAEAKAQWELSVADTPGTVRRILRKQLLIGGCSMDQISHVMGMHRRTLDRHLQRHGTGYGELVEAVKSDVARQLLRETGLHIQQIAASLHFSSAANFATAFRRWTGVTPSEYRRRAG